MPRVRWCSCPPWAALYLILALTVAAANAECYYEDELHPEGVEVPTAEPCLNCTCARGSLLCYLRVCPRLPNPPPPGCILLHRYRTCCPELICTDLGSTNALEARSDPDGLELPYENAIKNACIVNGSIYGPGSALDSSSQCRYCYCLGGKETCVKPKCLLPVEGCVPSYEANTCCPVHYKCSYPSSTSSTTTIQPIERGKDGCLVDGVYYAEGGKVLGVGHSICDNCYCLRGILRCEPLSCAPPLLGCAPVVRPGECCAASYNCSGTIEIQPEPNYGQFPIVSKEYAKLRKEVHVQPAQKVTENSNVPFYVIAESSQTTLKQRSAGTFGTTRHFTGVAFNPSTPPPSAPLTTKNAAIYYYSTTNLIRAVEKTTATSTSKPISSSTHAINAELDDGLLGIVDRSLVESRRDDDETSTQTSENPTVPTDSIIQSTAETIPSSDSTTTTEINTFDLLTTTTEPLNVSMLVTILNSTDCIDDSAVPDESGLMATTLLPVDANEINKLAEYKHADDYFTTSEVSSTEDGTTITTEELSTSTELEKKIATVRSIASVPILESILNSTKGKNQDYEYDYNEPSLPPSLPNLRIIPFVAADAVESKKTPPAFTSNERIDNSFAYPNSFSPPIETEGGFVPKEPPILDDFYKNLVTVPSITNTPKTHEVNCMNEGKKVLHGEAVPSETPCLICSCFYGNVVCQNKPCPIPGQSCRKSSDENVDTCCPQYVCDDETPTVVLDSTVLPEKAKTPDPFRDVIRTKPAPDLQSLIVDLMPFMTRTTTPLPHTTTRMKSEEVPPRNSTKEGGFLLDKVLELLFSNSNEATTTETSFETAATTSAAPSGGHSENKDVDALNSLGYNENSVDSGGLAILKLAGCNIYGRMYRVGRIISELSNPCLECKCTEIGVQCRALKC